MLNFKELMNSEQYNFLNRNERLGKRIMLLGLGGSYATEHIMITVTLISEELLLICLLIY
jgi:hypothetical protein